MTTNDAIYIHMLRNEPMIGECNTTAGVTPSHESSSVFSL